MDPITIVSCVAAGIKLSGEISGAIYTFVHETSHVDETFKIFADEIQSLSRLLKAIVTNLSHPLLDLSKLSTPQGGGGLQEIWEAIYGSVEDCRQYLEKLRVVVLKVQGKKDNDDLLSRTKRTIDMKLNKHEITAFRQALRSHQNDLNTAVVMLNVYLSYQSPAQIQSNLAAQVGMLRDLILQIPEAVSLQTGPREPIGSNSSVVLKKAAEKIFSNASVVSDKRSTIWGGSQRDFTTGSEFGEPLTQVEMSGIAMWQSNVDPAANESISSGPSTYSGPSVFSAAGTTSTIMEASSDDEGEIEADLVTHALSVADKFYGQQQYGRAVDKYRYALGRADGLDMTRREHLTQLKVAPVKLAKSLLEEGKFEESEKLLLGIVREHSTSDTHAAAILDASYHLGQMCLKKEDYKNAITYSLKTFTGRRRLLGKDAQATQDAVRTLVAAYVANGDEDEADAWSEMLAARSQSTNANPRVSTGDMSSLAAVVDTTGSVQTPPGNAASIAQASTPEGAVIRVLSSAGFVNNFNAMEAMKWAISQGQAGVVSVLLSGLTVTYDQIDHNGSLKPKSVIKSISINSIGEDNLTALMAAAKFGHENIVSLLVERKADLEVANRDGETALTIAVASNQLTAANSLLAAGANANVVTSNGISSLQRAIEAQREEMVSSLLLEGANPNFEVLIQGNDKVTPLILAAIKGNDRIVGHLSSHRAKIEAASTANRRTALGYAAGAPHKSTKVVEVLLRHKANVLARDRFGLSPLALAVNAGSAEICRLLLQNRSPINIADEEGRTEIMAAVSLGNDSIARLLLEHGATVEAEDRSGQDPLTVASRRNDEAMAKLLINFGARMKPMNNNHSQALLDAISRRHVAIARMLVEAGASARMSDPEGRAALGLAIRSEWVDIVQILLDVCRVPVEPVLGATSTVSPLEEAVATGNYDIVKLLLRSRALVEPPVPRFGPLHLAVANGSEPIVQILLQYAKNPNILKFLDPQPMGGRPSAQAVSNRILISPLMRATIKNDLQIMQTLLKYKANPNFFAQNSALLVNTGSSIDTTKASTPLIYAAIHNNAEAARLLISHGADINYRDFAKRTPLKVAVPMLADAMRIWADDYTAEKTQKKLEAKGKRLDVPRTDSSDAVSVDRLTLNSQNTEMSVETKSTTGSQGEGSQKKMAIGGRFLNRFSSKR